MKDNVKKDNSIKNYKKEIEEMRNVIGKLTEVLVILNKYFSINFENFTYFFIYLVQMREK